MRRKPGHNLEFQIPDKKSNLVLSARVTILQDLPGGIGNPFFLGKTPKNIRSAAELRHFAFLWEFQFKSGKIRMIP